MTPLRPGIRRLFRLNRLIATDVVRDVDDEMRLHIELRSRQLLSQGFDQSTAEAEARRLFARKQDTLNVLYATAKARDKHMRIREHLESWAQDARYAARGLLRDRTVTIFIVATLALGIGANVTSFSLVDRLLLRAPPEVHNANELTRLYLKSNEFSAGEQTTAWIPYATYENLRDNMSSFSSIGAYSVTETVVGRGEDARKRRVGTATPDFFAMLGTGALQGRMFSPGEEVSATGHVAVIGEQMWRESYSAAASAVGSTILVDQTPHVIVGIAPRGFSGAEMKRVDVWVLADTRTTNTRNWRIMGRLRPGTTLASAGAEAQALHSRTVFPSSFKWAEKKSVLAAPLHSGDTAEAPVEATMARWLAGVTGIIMLIAFANVVNLLLVRVARRRRELAIRVALGAGRRRVIRLLALEGALLAAVSGAASLLVAYIAEPIVRTALFAGNAGWTFSPTDSHVLAIAAAMVLLTALCVGIVPALQAGSPRLTEALRSGQIDARGSSRIRSALTVVQATLSVVLLVGASLFIRSLERVRAVDLGVDLQDVVVATAERLPMKVLTAKGVDDFSASEAVSYRRMLEEVRRLPGVANAAISVGLPLDGGSFSAKVFVAGIDSIPDLPGGGPYVSVVGSDYFATMGTRLLRGRAFTDADRENSERVIIIGETMARTLWPDGNPIGECVRIDRPAGECLRVVGVAADVRRTGLRGETSMQYYLAFGQPSPFGGASIVVRTDRLSPVAWPTIRQAMLSADNTLSSVEIAPLAAALDGEVRPLQVGMVTFGLSGFLALLVASLGLYSLMAYMVAGRTREIGVRLALGATDSQITRLVTIHALRLATLGILIGLTISVLGGRRLEAQLYETSAADPPALIAVGTTLLLVALVAGWIPARRALRISPTEALRSE